MIGIQIKTKRGVLGTFSGYQSIENLDVFAILKDKT